MTQTEKFQEEWISVFGVELPMPEYRFLGENYSTLSENGENGGDCTPTNKDSTKLDMIEVLEDDLKTTRETLLRLRTEVKAAKWCQDWLTKEISRFRKVSEGLEPVEYVAFTVDDELEEDDSPDASSLDSQSVDSAVDLPAADSNEMLASPSSQMDAPPIPQRRPSQAAKMTRVKSYKRASDNDDIESDSDSEDYDGIYENIALLQEKMKQRREEEQEKLKPSAASGRTLGDSPISSNENSPVGSPVTPSRLQQRIENETDFTTSFKVPGASPRESPQPNRRSGVIIETDIDGKTSHHLEPPPPVPVKRQSSWKELNAGDQGRIRAPSPAIRPRPSIAARTTASSPSSPAPPESQNADDSQQQPLRPANAPTLEKRLTNPDLERLNIRRAVLSTILEGEKKFIAGLEELVRITDSFRANMTTSESFLTREEFDTLFFRIPELCDVHKTFKELLEPKLSDWSPQKAFGDCFKYLASKFYIHEEYVSNYKRATKTFAELREEKPEFKSIADFTRGKLPNGESLTLEALMYSPLQRITKLTLTINDLLKHTPESHEDHMILIYVLEKTHKFITEVTSAIKDFSSTSVKKRSCQKHGYVVEWADSERKLRYLFLWSDLLICANKRTSGGVFSRDRGQFDCQWYLSLTDLSLIPNEQSEASSRQLPPSETKRLDGIKKYLAELNAEIKKDMNGKQSRHVQRDIEKKRKMVAEMEAQLTVLSPSLPLHLYHHNGKTYTLLMPSDYEKSDWREAILSAKRECRVTPNLNLGHINKLLSKFKQGRQASVRSIVVSQDADLVTGNLLITVVNATGLKMPSQLYCCIEVDAYGIFFLMAKTKTSQNTMTPEWNEDFDLEVAGAKTLRVICYDHTKGLEDEMIDKGQTVLKKEFLRSQQEIELSMDRLKVTLKIRFQSVAKTLKRVQSRKKVGVFGVRIGNLTKREASEMPKLIKTCATEVEKRGISELGIYRISGSIADINRLKKAFETGHKSVQKLVENMDIHAVAGLLKLYLRELPEPLFTHALYDKLTSGLTLSDAEAKKKYMMSLLMSMPEPNRTTIIFLFNHLKKIASNEGQNKMSLHNISTVFGPTLLSPANYGEQDPNDGFYGMTGALSQVGVLNYYLEHFSEKALTLIDSDTRVTV